MKVIILKRRRDGTEARLELICSFAHWGDVRNMTERDEMLLAAEMQANSGRADPEQDHAARVHFDGF